mmetsp:Transcript_12699/g.50984  ORF Transcript_12699/g.50984 Transcript_12699/m.50984 type:complete len:297 (+) Transcript_12699:4759-5649(+)
MRVRLRAGSSGHGARRGGGGEENVQRVGAGGRHLGGLGRGGGGGEDCAQLAVRLSQHGLGFQGLDHVPQPKHRGRLRDARGVPPHQERAVVAAHGGPGVRERRDAPSAAARVLAVGVAQLRRHARDSGSDGGGGLHGERARLPPADGEPDGVGGLGAGASRAPVPGGPARGSVPRRETEGCAAPASRLRRRRGQDERREARGYGGERRHRAHRVAQHQVWLQVRGVQVAGSHCDEGDELQGLDQGVPAPDATRLAVGARVPGGRQAQVRRSAAAFDRDGAQRLHAEQRGATSERRG